MTAPRISAGWDHDRNHYHFSRAHRSRAPFDEEQPSVWFQLGVAFLLAGGFSAFCFVALGC